MIVIVVNTILIVLQHHYVARYAEGVAERGLRQDLVK